MSNLRPYTHRIYIDFSGDDGDPGKRGATRTMCVGWVVSQEMDINHNLGVIANMKRVIGCKPADELKYSSLRRHSRRHEALALLSEARIEAAVNPVIKERITDSQLKDSRTKELIHTIHQFPVKSLVRHLGSTFPDIYFQLVFDRIGWRGSEDAITTRFRNDPGWDWSGARPDWLEFKDWTDRPLLQMADIIAGLGRDYAESVLARGSTALCAVCALGIRGSRFPPRPKRCRGRATGGNLSLWGTLSPLLLRRQDGRAWDLGFFVRPPSVRAEWVFVDCPAITEK